MSKDGAIKVMGPPTKAVMEKFPAMEMLAEAKDTGKHAIAEAREMSLRTRKTVIGWWRALPNAGIRAAVAAGVGLVIGMIPVLFIFSWRRHAPHMEGRHAARP